MKHLSRILFVAMLWGFILVPSPGLATNYQDWWWDPTTSGQGINIGHQGNMIGAAWFMYDQAGSDMWVLLVGPLVGNTVSGGLERYTGPPLGTPFNPAQGLGDCCRECHADVHQPQYRRPFIHRERSTRHVEPHAVYVRADSH